MKQENVEKVITALCSLESDNNPNAVGDGGRAVGILQIWPIMVREANRIAGRRQWETAHRWNPDSSVSMARTVLTHYAKVKRLGDTPEDMVRLGGLWNRPDGKAPAVYLAKVSRHLGMVGK